MFLNRYNEKKILRESFRVKSGNLGILYGRRRIGKSALLNEVITKNDIYFLADMRETPLQIKELQNILSKKLPGFENIILPDWTAFFSALKGFIKNPFTLVLDEFPYLVKNAPELPSIIQKQIDTKNLNNINIILCGSSQSMMTNLFNNSKAPLYGRASTILKLSHLPISYIMKLLNISAEKAVEEYSVWGGIPRYWKERAKYSSLFIAIEKLVISKYALFYDEPIILFLDEMRTSMQSNSILSLVANGANKLSEIASRLQKPATNLSRPLQLLIELGYLKRETSFGELEKNAKKTLYKIADPFLNFHFKFAASNRSLIELGMNDIVIKKIKNQWTKYVSVEYEDICRKSIPFLFKKEGNFTPGKRYWDKNVEFDLITKDLDKDIFIVGEVKWTNKIDIKSIDRLLDKKIEMVPFLTKGRIIKVIFGKKRLSQKNIIYFSADDVLKVLSN